MMNEQTFMYMPVTPYGLGIDLSKELTQKQIKFSNLSLKLKLYLEKQEEQTQQLTLLHLQ